MAARQGIRIRGINRSAKYKMKYTYSQTARAKNGKQTTRYSYSKQIVSAKKYAYK